MYECVTPMHEKHLLTLFLLTISLWSVKECDQFVTDGHFQIFQILKASKKISDKMWWIDFWFIGEGCHSVIWMPWSLIYMRIHEMLNVMGLTFYYSFAIFILRAWTHLILPITDVGHINWFPKEMWGCFLPDTLNFKPSTSFHERCENVHITDIHLAKNAIFDNTPAEKWFGQKKLYLGNSEELNFYNLG